MEEREGRDSVEREGRMAYKEDGDGVERGEGQRERRTQPAPFLTYLSPPRQLPVPVGFLLPDAGPTCDSGAPAPSLAVKAHRGRIG